MRVPVTPALDAELAWLAGGVVLVLVVATVLVLARARRLAADAQPGSEPRARAARLGTQVVAWWVMGAVFFLAVLTGPVGAILLFGLVSFLALREFMTMTPTSAADHSVLFWAFFVVTPAQYLLVALGWFGLYTILIPVYAFLLIPTRSALAGERTRFLERIATIQWGLMVSVYCLSHAPALLTLAIAGYEGENGKLLVFFVLLVQGTEVLAYVGGRWLGGRRLAPRVDPAATWPGALASIAGTAVLGTALSWATPYPPPLAAAVAALVAALALAGRLTMIAIRRDRGMKDGGVVARIDSLCFAAPVFFHVTRYFFG